MFSSNLRNNELEFTPTFGTQLKIKNLTKRRYMKNSAFNINVF